MNLSVLPTAFRSRPGARRWLIALLLPLAFAACQTTPPPPRAPSAPATWKYAKVATASGITKSGYLDRFLSSPRGAGSWLDGIAKGLRPGTTAPAVIWLHGCHGQTEATDLAIRNLSSAGYTVFAPDSLARPRRTRCHADKAEMIALRHEEVKYALSQIRNLPWVEQDHLILAGHDEGGHAAAAWRGREFKAHLLFGTDCRYSGGTPGAPDGVRVLNLVGANDPQGFGEGCALSPSQRAGGSQVIRYPGLGHNILRSPQVELDLKRFLRKLGA